MRRPSPRMQPHVVAVVRNREGADQDGGRRVVASSRLTASCFVQPGESRTIIDSSDATGWNRVVEFNPTKIFFVDDAGIRSQDQLEWIDAAGRIHVYLVEGYYPPCGTNVLWHAVCKERI